jgi:hypothetical protein
LTVFKLLDLLDTRLFWNLKVSYLTARLVRSGLRPPPSLSTVSLIEHIQYSFVSIPLIFSPDFDTFFAKISSLVANEINIDVESYGR